jgi:hypothetical protein
MNFKTKFVQFIYQPNNLKMHSFASLVSFFFFFVVTTCQHQTVSEPIKATSSLDLPSFLGRWFMVYAPKMPQSTFTGAACVVEDFKLKNDVPASNFVPTNVVSVDMDISFTYAIFSLAAQ